MAVASVEGEPLRLKDLLELDCDSCSAAGFRCYPRHLCVAAPPPARHHEPHAGAFFRRHPMLSLRSLSRRLRGSFSFSRSRGDDDDDEEQAAPAVPAASISGSGSGSSYSESSESLSAGRKSESDFSSACSAESGLRTGVAATDGHEQHEAIMERGSKEAGSGSEADSGEQLSPVAVMDFPFDDDDDVEEEEGRDAACSPSFRDSRAQLHQRRNIRLQHKLRRHRSIGELGPLNLDARLAASDPDALATVPAQQPHRPSLADAATAPSGPKGSRSDDDRSLLAPLTTGAVPAAAADASERLLQDFFAEAREPLSSPEDCEAALRAAEGWIQGAGPRWGLKEVLCGREDLVAEMERSRRWSVRAGQGQEEEREIGVAVAGLVIDELVHELVRDMLL